ncbi:MAG: hypothetical protein ABEI86_09550, partial [Halobacteriaceae archaeon]
MGARKINAIMSGIGPILGVILSISPFLLEGVFLNPLQSTILGIAIGVSLLFVFGAYLADISEQNWVVAGIRMGLAGLVVAAINIL